MWTAFTKYLTTWPLSKVVFNRHFKVQMDLIHNEALVNWDSITHFSSLASLFCQIWAASLCWMCHIFIRWESERQRNCAFFMFNFAWVGESSSSLLLAAVIPWPHFTSLVINSLCQSSWVIGRTSSPVKRLISAPLCGWLKAIINNEMGFAQDLFSCTLLQPVMSGYLVN